MSEIRFVPLGKAVREMRKKNGLRQEDLALYAGVSAKFIHDLEKRSSASSPAVLGQCLI